MCGMWCVPQGIEKQYIQVVQLCKRLFRDRAEVGEICSLAETKPNDLSVSMHYFYRHKICAEQLHRPIDSVQLNLCQTTELVISVENVTKHISQKSAHLRPCIERDLIRSVITQRPHIVQT